MKALVVCEARGGVALDSAFELLEVASRLGAEPVMVLVGPAGAVPAAAGRLLLAEVERAESYDPGLHRNAVLEAVRREEPDVVLLPHSSYGWDLAPRIAAALRAAQVSELVALAEGGGLEVACCNGKMRRVVQPATPRVVVTVQPGAFPAGGARGGPPSIERIEAAPGAPGVEYLGHEAPSA
ncbi:MAG: hypothetical protein WCC48_12990, partial [Anaeromyxobacteraceae bacterium]